MQYKDLMCTNLSITRPIIDHKSEDLIILRQQNKVEVIPLYVVSRDFFPL